MTVREEVEAEVQALQAILDDMSRQIESRRVVEFEGEFEELTDQQKDALIVAQTELLALHEKREQFEIRLARLLEVDFGIDGFLVDQGKDSQSSTPSRMGRPPGRRLGRVLSFLLTRRAYEKTVAPVIADAQHEYLEAVAAGHYLHSRWIAVRLWIIIWPGWVYGLFASMIRHIIGAGTSG